MKKLLSPWFALLTLILVVSIRISDTPFVESTRLRYFDTLINSKPSTISENIEIVNIDDATIEKYGQFPFPRSTYAKIIEDLYGRGAGLVVFNVFMPDRDRFGHDNALATIASELPIVLPQTATNDTIKTDTQAFRPGVSVIGDTGQRFTVDYENIQPNVKEINDAASGAGVVNTFPEIDGVVRRVPMLVSSKGLLYPSISLETLRVASGDPSFQVKVSELGVEAVRIPKFGKITTDAFSRIWVDWSHRANEWSVTSPPDNFLGRIVIVGLTARGLNNPIATSNGAQFPHALQSAVLDTLLSGTNITRPDWADGAEILCIVLISVIAIFLTKWKYGFIPILSVIGGSYYASSYLFNTYGYLIDITAFIFSLFCVYGHSYTVKFITELNAKLQIKKQFGTYLSPALVEKLQKNPELLRLGGESRQLSIMFTDVRGFTTISEHYGENVQGLTQIMNRYMTAMTASIIKNNGTLDKYIGDAQMAFWNAPLDDPNHAKSAVKTALEMMEKLDAFNEEIAQEGVPAFGMGLGINTGTVVVGNMGSDQRFDYTCLGDHVNLASRLEGQSKPYGVKIILGPQTAEQVKDEYDVVELDCIAVKGKTEGVKIYTLGKEELQDNFLFLYYGGNWKQAIQIAELAIKKGTCLEKYYKSMIERLKEGCPKDWDGTFRATSK
jgi:adenylate cyclase